METKLNYSEQAKLLLSKLKESSIDIQEFEEWVIKNKFVVGGGFILEYLGSK
jgi:hypothetical protein